jgi:hypothetical protein
LRKAAVLVPAAVLALTGAYALAQEDPIGDILNRQPAQPAGPAARPPAPSTSPARQGQPAVPAAAPPAGPQAPATPPPAPASEAPPPPSAAVPNTVSSPAELPPEPKKPAPVVTKAPTTPPGKRPRYSVAIVQAVDKITAESMRFEAPVGQPVRYKNLIFTVRSCEATASDELERDAIAHIEVDFQPPAPAGRTPTAAKSVYRGWMFAASPSLSPLEHPVYDAWLIACKAA